MTPQQAAVAEVLAWRPPDGREWDLEEVTLELARRDAPVVNVGAVLTNMEAAGLAARSPGSNGAGLDVWALTAEGLAERGRS